MSGPPTKRPLADRSPAIQSPAWVGGAAWAGSIGLHGAALLALTFVVVGAFRTEQAPPRLAVSQQAGPAGGAPLVDWAQPPTVEPPSEPLEAPPEVPPLELEEPMPTVVPTGSRAAPKRVRAADAVRPIPQPQPKPATPAQPTPTPPAKTARNAKAAAKPAPAAEAPVAGARKPAEAGTPARVRSRATPRRPSKCVRRGHVGTVIVTLYVGPDGLAYHPKVERSSGCKRLDGAAVAAVRKYTFHPATQGGQAVTSRERIVIRFRPQT